LPLIVVVASARPNVPVTCCAFEGADTSKNIATATAGRTNAGTCKYSLNLPCAGFLMPDGKSTRFLLASKIEARMWFPYRVSPFRKCGKVLQYFANIGIQGPDRLFLF
jgi:hypothetical protein